MSTAVGIVFDHVDDFGELVDVAAIGRGPVAPLRAVDAAEVAVFVGPFVPDRDFVFFEVADVGVALDEPE